MDTLDTRLRKRIHVSLYALLFLTGLLGLSVILEGCTDTCQVENEFVYYEPVYTTFEELRTSVQTTAPRTIEGVGKIYIKDNLLFVNEPGRGIHVIDNGDPASPAPLTFVEIPGNYDLAVKGNSLYADSFVDLVVLDISNPAEIKEVNRIQNIFSSYNSLGFYTDATRGVITEWVERTDVKVYESDCDANIEPWGGMYYAEGIAVKRDMAFNASAAIAPGNGSGPGVGGSMARITISGDYLYTLDGSDVQAVNIASEREPVTEGRTFVGWDIETIFPHDRNLFIGSRSGMHILDLATPAQPARIATYEHVQVCDPVVVEGNYAYVTLRSGTECRGFTNQLEVINIENLATPQLTATYQMHNPHGLGIDNGTLFICDGDDGLKIYDASDVQAIDRNMIAHYSDINTFDVIPFNNLLIMIGADGIFQYDYSDPADIKFLSKMNVDADQ